eukprot:CAMPEP_0169333724 /NCGR_PEP_ID=MMETSP1017-20121227/15411_1 /TAXON_ID=342587 /ORGANISM="Karlodinium micrum, Strain CCMP2283" /LENGTH=497 /DNA_ID=CAMNT_0009428963 /DNA_START=65 /DNA_END=1555 /DNA_ORIENTATION=-
MSPGVSSPRGAMSPGVSSPRPHVGAFGWTGVRSHAGLARMTSVPTPYSPSPRVLRSPSVVFQSAAVVRSASVSAGRPLEPSPVPTPVVSQSSKHISPSYGLTLSSSRLRQNGSPPHASLRQPASTCEPASSSMPTYRTSSSSCEADIGNMTSLVKPQRMIEFHKAGLTYSHGEPLPKSNGAGAPSPRCACTPRGNKLISECATLAVTQSCSSSVRVGGTNKSESSTSSAPTVDPSSKASVVCSASSSHRPIGVTPLPIEQISATPSQPKEALSLNTNPEAGERLHKGSSAISTSLRREALGMSVAKRNEFHAEVAFRFRQNQLKALDFEDRSIIERSVAELVRRVSCDMGLRPYLQEGPVSDFITRDHLDISESDVLPSAIPSIDTSKLLSPEEVTSPSLEESQRSGSELQADETFISDEDPQRLESEHRTDWEGVWSAMPAQLLGASITNSESIDAREEDYGPCLMSSSELLPPTSLVEDCSHDPSDSALGPTPRS